MLQLTRTSSSQLLSSTSSSFNASTITITTTLPPPFSSFSAAAAAAAASIHTHLSCNWLVCPACCARAAVRPRQLICLEPQLFLQHALQQLSLTPASLFLRLHQVAKL
jgi:hypothetical protein